MQRRSFAVRACALLALAPLGCRTLPAVAAENQTAVLAHRAVALWTQPATAAVFSGFDGDDGADRWQVAYPDDGLFAYDHILHVAGRPDVVDSAGPRWLVAEYRAAFPDLTLAVDDMRVEGERATARWTLQGTFLGPFDGLAPTGQPVTEKGTFVIRVAGDQIVETWVDADTAAMLRQAGAAPLPAPQAWVTPTLVVAPRGAPADAPSDFGSYQPVSSQVSRLDRAPARGLNLHAETGGREPHGGHR